MDPGQNLCKIDRTLLSQDKIAELDKTAYRSLIGCLLYIAISICPDIVYAIQQLSQYIDLYSMVQWRAAIRLAHYLKGTQNLKLVLEGRDKPINLTGFTDLDWADCFNTW
ncbi:Copia protein [Termitomyces sp. J132]|nr:Copia protein [Termitomyces sp. J132]